jgi:hypothetical protein
MSCFNLYSAAEYAPMKSDLIELSRFYLRTAPARLTHTEYLSTGTMANFGQIN